MALEVIKECLSRHIGDRRFPGCAFAYGNADAWESGTLGRIGYGPGWPEVSPSTFYDLASLTKVMATAAIFKHLVENGLVELDKPISCTHDWVAKSDVSVRNLLTHTANLPPYFAWPSTGKEYVQRSDMASEIETLLNGAAGQLRAVSSATYSCIGFLFLRRIAESVTGKTLAHLFSEVVANPLEIEATFCPEDKRACAPTSSVEPWRRSLSQGQHLQGDVHDPLAFGLGGVSGNAGMFSNLSGVALFAQSVLRDPVWWPWLIPHGDTDRGLGWQTSVPFSDALVGHSGYSGTGLWFNRGLTRFCVLLSNTVHPTGKNLGLNDVRGEFCSLAICP
ncbi:MAG: serine hydrolase [Chthonomonadaceae bacterium]|nr:serine hydrolase [Chthonomonadaceae bacterium]